jgi:hypothetical protein
MLDKKNLIELSHVTYENNEKFGCTFEQRKFINDLVYRSSITVQNKILDKFGLSVQYKLINTEASKLIDCLLAEVDFEILEYGTPEWHAAKLSEQREKLVRYPREAVNIEFTFDENYVVPDSD